MENSEQKTESATPGLDVDDAARAVRNPAEVKQAMEAKILRHKFVRESMRGAGIGGKLDQGKKHRATALAQAQAKYDAAKAKVDALTDKQPEAA